MQKKIGRMQPTTSLRIAPSSYRAPLQPEAQRQKTSSMSYKHHMSDTKSLDQNDNNTSDASAQQAHHIVFAELRIQTIRCIDHAIDA
jgi:hypothetical protein